MEKWSGLGRLCTEQDGFPIGCGGSGRGPPGLGFFKQTFQWDCLLPCGIAALEPDKGESEGHRFLREAKVTTRFSQLDCIKILFVVLKTGVGGHHLGLGVYLFWSCQSCISD